MRILHAITGMQKAAGTSVFCGELCNELVRTGHEVTIAVSSINQKDRYEVDSRVRWIPFVWLWESEEHFDIVHIHALWSPALHRVAKWARRMGMRIIWSPHGMLTSWAFHFKWWKKLPVWYLYQKRDLEKAALIHVTAESEVEDVRRVGLTNKVIIAPLGVRLPSEEFIKTSIPLGGGYCSSSAVSNGRRDLLI